MNKFDIIIPTAENKDILRLNELNKELFYIEMNDHWDDNDRKRSWEINREISEIEKRLNLLEKDRRGA